MNTPEMVIAFVEGTKKLKNKTFVPPAALDFQGQEYAKLQNEAYALESKIETATSDREREILRRRLEQVEQARDRKFHARIILCDGAQDLIFQFFMDPFPREFQDLVTAVVTDHFGSTDRFALEWVPEVRSFALLARGIWGNPLRDETRITAGFLTLVENTLAELKVHA